MSRAGFVGEALETACASLGVDEVGVAVSSTVLTSLWGLVESTGSLIRALDDEQFDLGVGPTPAALRHGSVHVARDLSSDRVVDPHATFLAWSASRIGVGSMVAIAMQLPTDQPAALVLTRRVAGPPVDVDACRTSAAAVAVAIARDIDRRLIWGTVGDHWIDRFTGGRDAYRPPTHDALNRRLGVMVAVDLIADGAGCGLRDALARLRGYAFRCGAPVTDVAEMVAAESVSVDDLLG